MIQAQLSEIGFRGTRLPWHEHPFRLINWLQMNKFSAEGFYKLGAGIGNLSQHLHYTLKYQWPMDDVVIEGIIGRLMLIKEECGKIALVQSAKFATRHLAKYEQNGMELREAQMAIDALKELIHSEMEEQLFLWIEARRADAYTQKKPFFGATVRSKFPSASLDIEEAGKCFACGRHTGSVMHCMRVLEHGLRALCVTLEVSFGEGTWHRAFDRIEKRITVLDSQVKQQFAWRKKRQFYMEAVAEFRHFKDAWRNHAAHGHAHYDEERSEKIIEHTRNFMQVLATRLKEKKA